MPRYRLTFSVESDDWVLLSSAFDAAAERISQLRPGEETEDSRRWGATVELLSIVEVAEVDPEPVEP